MSSSAARFVILLLPLFAALVRAVSLADFTPRVEDLSSQCDAVYNRQIKDCEASDLQTGENCSVACISGLLLIAQQVKSACANDDVAETSIIGVFLLGKGPEILCSNIAATTIGSGQTSTASTTSSIIEQSSTLELSSQTTAEGTTIVAGTSTTAKATTTAASTTSTAASTTTSAAETTSAATTAAESTTETTAAATSSSETQQAASTSSGASDLASLNEGSGGGSPFDFVSGAASSQATASTWLMGAALGLCGFLLHSLS